MSFFAFAGGEWPAGCARRHSPFVFVFGYTQPPTPAFPLLLSSILLVFFLSSAAPTGGIPRCRAPSGLWTLPGSRARGTPASGCAAAVRMLPPSVAAASPFVFLLCVWSTAPPLVSPYPAAASRRPLLLIFCILALPLWADRYFGPDRAHPASSRRRVAPARRGGQGTGQEAGAVECPCASLSPWRCVLFRFFLPPTLSPSFP